MGLFLKTVLAVAAGMLTQLALAFDPFVVRDIRLVGVQRVEPGTVFGYLPLKVGERVDDERAAAAVRALFATGLFSDVRLEVEGDVLIVHLDERPAIASIDISGAKEIDSEALLKGLRDLGLAESRIYDRALLERAEQEIKRQYLARSRYGVQITSTVTPLERNRVAVTLAIEEGETARIAQIRIIGNRTFSERELIEQLTLTTPTWLSWYTKSDRYSRERLAGDLESLRSFYLNRGFLEFSIDSTQVSIAPDREDVFITVSITEGERYTVTGWRLTGNTLGRDEELGRLIQLKPGDVFSGEKLAASARAMTDLFGQIGYAFANVNTIPEVDRANRQVAFNIAIDPGRRSYVRRIDISGNARTRDEVIRRELRQFEGAWFDSDRIRLSRERLDRLGFFTQVAIETVPVPDAPDQVDLNVVVEERSTGSFLLGVGFSSTDNLILTASVSQQNFLGSGKSLALEINTGSTQRALSVRSVDPYFTADGVSRQLDASYRRLNASQLNLGDYQLDTSALGLRFGVPYTEVDRVLFGLAYERNALRLGANAPNRFLQYVSAFGPDAYAVLATAGWTRDGRDSALTPTRSYLLSASAEVTLPVGELRYGRGQLVGQWYYPMTRDYTIAIGGDIAHGSPFGGRIYPIFKNYYAGGIGSVRGFDGNSLGARDNDGNPLGGQSRLVLSTELLFPMPGSGNDRSLRMFTFADVGNVFTGTVRADDLRASVGIGINWLSPIGPLKLSMGYPVRREPEDRVQRFQFQIGTGF
jgi:outer membrane protein insertion porin family